MSHFSASGDIDGEAETHRVRQVEALFASYGGLVYNKSLRMLRDRQEAEDATQEVFLAAFRNLASPRRSEAAGTLPWIYKIATHVCLRMLRTRRRRPATPDANVERRTVVVAGFGEALDARRVLESLVGQLSERDAQILVAHFIDGMHQGQIAGSLGITRRTVVRRIAALRTKLAALVEKGPGGAK